MGFGIFDLNVPTTKTSSALLCLTHDDVADSQPSACINCGRCVEVCPGRVVPKLLADYAERHDLERFEACNGLECCECGCCSYVCPAKRPLTQAIKSARKMVLAEKKKKVLAIDLDPQGNMTSGLGVNKDEVENTVYNLMLDECSIAESIENTVVDNLYVIPSNVNLAGAEIELLGINDKEYILKSAVDYIKEDYDFIIIDCPPSLNMLTVNAMTTADTVLVPIQCEYYALEGLSQLIHTINLVQERLNPELQIEGVVFTMYDVRTNLSNQVVETVKENLDTKIYNTMIPRNIRLAEAPSYGIPINMYDSKSAGAESYRNLAKEIIARKDI